MNEQMNKNQKDLKSPVRIHAKVIVNFTANILLHSWVRGSGKKNHYPKFIKAMNIYTTIIINDIS